MLIKSSEHSMYLDSYGDCQYRVTLEFPYTIGCVIMTDVCPSCNNIAGN